MKRKRHRTRYPGVMYRLTDEADPDSQRRYLVFWTDSNGKQHNETLPLGATLEDAKNRRAALVTRKAQGESLIKTRMCCDELLDSWLETRKPSLKATTVEAYEWGAAVAKEHLGRRKLVDLTPGDVFRMRASLQRQGLKTWSIKKVETPLKGALQMAAREGWIYRNPYATPLPHERLKTDQKEMRCLTKEEIEKLLLATSSERWRTLFAMLTFTGMRISEALSLTWTNIDFVSSLIHVRKGKTEAAERSILLIPALRSRLSALKLSQPPGTSLVFTTLTGAPMGRRHVLRVLRATEKKAGIPDYTLHELRHTFASILIAQGELPTFVASQMGHKDPGVTMKTYAHLFEKEESITRASKRLQETFGGMV